MHSSIEVEVGAPASLVFELARDVERWPALLPHYLRVRVLTRHLDDSLTARFVAVRTIVPVLGLGLPLVWRSRVRADAGSLQLRFLHLGGATGGMVATWRLVPTDTGCRASIEHDFQPRVRWWGWAVDRFFVRATARRTLASFKAVAEAAAAATREAPRSGRAKSPKRTAR